MLGAGAPATSTMYPLLQTFAADSEETDHLAMDEAILQIQACMYQYSRAIYRTIKDKIDPYVDEVTQLEYRRDVLAACEQTRERLATTPSTSPSRIGRSSRTFAATSRSPRRRR